MEAEAGGKRRRGRPKGSTKKSERRVRLNFVLEEPYAEQLKLIADVERSGNLSELLRELCIEELIRRKQISPLIKLL